MGQRWAAIRMPPRANGHPFGRGSLRVLGVIEVGVGIRGLIGGMLSGVVGRSEFWGLSFDQFALAAGLLILIGSLQLFLANSVRRHARWAYVVVLVINVFVFVSLLVELYLPGSTSGVADPEATLLAWIYFVMTLGSAALLLTSFVRREVD
jgi:hypothetical protein